MHHYITKYEENGQWYAESWIQINFLWWYFCFSKKKIKIWNQDEIARYANEIVHDILRGYKVDERLQDNG